MTRRRRHGRRRYYRATLEESRRARVEFLIHRPFTPPTAPSHAPGVASRRAPMPRAHARARRCRDDDTAPSILMRAIIRRYQRQRVARATLHELEVRPRIPASKVLPAVAHVDFRPRSEPRRRHIEPLSPASVAVYYRERFLFRPGHAMRDVARCRSTSFHAYAQQQRAAPSVAGRWAADLAIKLAAMPRRRAK